MQDVERWLQEFQKYSCLYEKGNKGYKERDRKKNAWRAIFKSVFMNNKGPSHTLKGRTCFFITFTKKVNYTNNLKFDSLSLKRISCNKLW